MSKRTKFDFERLDMFCKENNITLLEDYSCKFVTINLLVKGNCSYENCNNVFEKTNRQLENTGGFCKVCTKIIALNKRKQSCIKKYGVSNITQSNEYKNSINSPIYNFNLLHEYSSHNKITLSENYVNEKLHAHYYIKGICSNEVCLNIFTKKFHKLINTNALCNSCIINKAKEKRKQTNITNIGFENYFQDEIVKNKIKETNLIKYGVEYACQNEEIKNKTKDTCFKKYGVLHHSYLQNVQNKISSTNLIKYGVEHLMKEPAYLENMLKISHKFKDYVLPSGNIIKYQGYENCALDDLINNNTDESDIIMGTINVPIILYLDETGKQRRHFVDIFIPSQNKCIEVKSTWTFTKPNVLCKQIAAKQQGYKYEIWVYDKKGNKNIYK
jgi:hypothetical protein